MTGFSRRALLGALAASGCASVDEPDVSWITIIAHRGASAMQPEHTMAAYQLAAEQRADYIEPDLVMTRDGALVCRHENEISGTTDVAAHAEFASRRTRKFIDGQNVEGWFVEDFTLAELKTLRCKERLPDLRPANTRFDGQEAIPTFAELLAFALPRNIGVYPELKHPTFLREQGLDPVAALIAATQNAGGQTAADRLFVQCFEIGTLVQIASISSLRFNTIQLIAAEGGPWDEQSTTYSQMISEAGLARIRTYALGVGVEKSLVIPRDENGALREPTALVRRARAARLLVHAWTFRPENAFLPLDFRVGDPAGRTYDRARGDTIAEIRAFIAAGVDGVFCDLPADAAAAARRPR